MLRSTIPFLFSSAMSLRHFLILFGISGTLLSSGCRREGISVYTAPKDPPELAAEPASDEGEGHVAPAGHTAGEEHATAAGHAGHAAGAGHEGEEERPKLGWVLPTGWEETAPSRVSVASFSIKTKEGEVTVNITPLPNLAGKEEMVVNMWREQVGQGPLKQEELKSALSAVAVAGGSGQMFEISGTREGSPTRIITAMLHQSDASWFFKLAGNEAAAIAQKPFFLEFIKSVRLPAPKPPTSLTPALPRP